MLQPAQMIHRHGANPILSARDIPYDATLVFNAGVAKFQGRYVMAFRNDYGGAPESPQSASSEQILSEQEVRVLTYAAKGYSYDEIASLMSVSRHTVQTYVKRSYRKLHVNSKIEALDEARRLCLIES